MRTNQSQLGQHASAISQLLHITDKIDDQTEKTHGTIHLRFATSSALANRLPSSVGEKMSSGSANESTPPVKRLKLTENGTSSTSPFLSTMGKNTMTNEQALDFTDTSVPTGNTTTPDKPLAQEFRPIIETPPAVRMPSINTTARSSESQNRLVFMLDKSDGAYMLVGNDPKLRLEVAKYGEIVGKGDCSRTFIYKMMDALFSLEYLAKCTYAGTEKESGSKEALIQNDAFRAVLAQTKMQFPGFEMTDDLKKGITMKCGNSGKRKKK